MVSTHLRIATVTAAILSAAFGMSRTEPEPAPVQVGRVRPIAAMSAARAAHTATALLNGAVLIVGGFAGSENQLAGAEIFEPGAERFTKTGQPDEAIRHYRRALDLDSGLSGAHYGLAFLMLKRGDAEKAVDHLRAFLARPPRGADGERWIKHAETALRELDETAEPRVSAVGSA